MVHLYFSHRNMKTKRQLHHRKVALQQCWPVRWGRFMECLQLMAPSSVPLHYGLRTKTFRLKKSDVNFLPMLSKYFTKLINLFGFKTEDSLHDHFQVKPRHYNTWNSLLEEKNDNNSHWYIVIMLISDLPSLYAWRPLGKCHCTEVLLNTLKHGKSLWFTLMVLLTINFFFFFYCRSGNWSWNSV